MISSYLTRLSTVVRHARRHSIACLALFLTLGGTAYAQAMIGSADIIDGSIRGVDVANSGLTGVDVADNSVTGNDVSEATLKVPDMGCQPGKVNGHARVFGHDTTPEHYTTHDDFIDYTNNCNGADPEVRRASEGVYYVRFPNNVARLAVVTLNSDRLDTSNPNADNMISVAKIPASAAGTRPEGDQGAFRVQVRDADDDDGGSDPQDGGFTIALL